MAQLNYPLLLTGPLLAARGKARPAYTGARPASAPVRLARDFRLIADTTGTIANNNRVMYRVDPSAPELPFAGARVRLHRLADGYCAWEGISDANGTYHASGLEVGLLYYPIAIDLARQFECVAAGPVLAVRAAL